MIGREAADRWDNGDQRDESELGCPTLSSLWSPLPNARRRRAHRSQLTGCCNLSVFPCFRVSVSPCLRGYDFVPGGICSFAAKLQATGLMQCVTLKRLDWGPEIDTTLRCMHRVVSRGHDQHVERRRCDQPEDDDA